MYIYGAKAGGYILVSYSEQCVFPFFSYICGTRFKADDPPPPSHRGAQFVL